MLLYSYSKLSWKKTVVLALCALQAVYCQVSLIRNFNPQDCIVEGTVITLTCTVEDRNNGFGATIINGSQAIFDCSSFYSILDNKLYLRHSQMESAIAYCGNFVSGRLKEVELNGTTFVYIAQISVLTSIAMNGGYVECSELGKNDSQRIMLANIKGLFLPTIYVEFPSEATFFIYWNQANENATQIAHYFTNVTGEDCGNCTNLGIISNVTNQLSCTGWEPNGQICNVTVTAIGFACGLRQLSSSRLVYLRVPEAPLLEDIMPIYSYDLKELQSVKILLTVESTVDINGFPITIQVNVDRSSQTISKCSLNISAGNKCLSTEHSKFRCEIDFTLRRSCPQLLSQPEQEADYQIVVFSESSIGRSSLNTISIPSYAHLMVQLLFEPQQNQQNQEDTRFVFISFSQVYATVISMIEYGSNCQTLDNQATIASFNVTNGTTLTFRISGIMDDICFIVKINNTFQSIAIQGNFTFETKDASQELNDYIFSAGGVSASVIIVTGGMITTIAFVWYIRRKRQTISVGISQSELLSSEADQDKHNSKTFSDARS